MGNRAARFVGTVRHVPPGARFARRTPDDCGAQKRCPRPAGRARRALWNGCGPGRARPAAPRPLAGATSRLADSSTKILSVGALQTAPPRGRMPLTGRGAQPAPIGRTRPRRHWPSDPAPPRGPSGRLLLLLAAALFRSARAAPSPGPRRRRQHDGGREGRSLEPFATPAVCARHRRSRSAGRLTGPFAAAGSLEPEARAECHIEGRRYALTTSRDGGRASESTPSAMSAKAAAVKNAYR